MQRNGSYGSHSQTSSVQAFTAPRIVGWPNARFSVYGAPGAFNLSSIREEGVGCTLLTSIGPAAEGSAVGVLIPAAVYPSLGPVGQSLIPYEIPCAMVAAYEVVTVHVVPDFGGSGCCENSLESCDDSDSCGEKVEVKHLKSNEELS